MTDYRKLTQEELLSEAAELFGPDPINFAFRCPNCDDVATIGEFVAAGVDPGRAGQECLGRHLGALSKQYAPGDYAGRGCNWVAYGLIRGPWEIVLPAEGDKPVRSMWAFPLAVTA